MEQAWVEYAGNTGWEITENVAMDWAMYELKAMENQDGYIHPGNGITQDMIDWVQEHVKQAGIDWENVPDLYE